MIITPSEERDMNAVLDAACEVNRADRKDVLSRGRGGENISLTRHMAMLVMSNIFAIPDPKIAAFMGRCRSDVTIARKRVQGRSDVDRKVREKINEIVNKTTTPLTDDDFMTPANAKTFKDGFKWMQGCIHRNAAEKGFWEASSNFGEKIALCHSELSEALEFHRKDDGNDDKLTHRKGAEVELADTVIRIMDLSEKMGYDLAGAIIEKHEYNRKREKMHGKRF